MEHLLRDVKDATLSSLAGDVSGRLLALKGLSSRLALLSEYLGHVLDGRLPANHDIINHVQVGGQLGRGVRGRREWVLGEGLGPWLAIWRGGNDQLSGAACAEIGGFAIGKTGVLGSWH